MNDKPSQVRWPVLEYLLLVLFLIPFTDAVPLVGGLQVLFGRLPPWLQMGIVFVIPPLVLLSSVRLTILAGRTGRPVLAAACGLCALLGLTALGYATLVTFALGAGPQVVPYAAVGLAIAALLFVARGLWKAPAGWRPLA